MKIARAIRHLSLGTALRVCGWGILRDGSFLVGVGAGGCGVTFGGGSEKRRSEGGLCPFFGRGI